MEKLQDAGILSEGSAEHVKKLASTEDSPSETATPARGHDREIKGIPWFEEVIEGSELGRIKRRRGGDSSADGKTVIEWEVTEMEGAEGDGGGTGALKRKLESLNGEDVDMK